MTDPDAIDVFDDVDGVELLQRTTLFRTLGFDETRKLAGLLQVERFSRGDTVLAQGALGTALYIVQTGEVEVAHVDDDGESHVLGRLGEGELFGEMSLVDDMLVSADVRVTSDAADILVIPRAGFDELLESDDAFAARVYRAFCQTLAGRLRSTSERLSEAEGTA